MITFKTISMQNFFLYGNVPTVFNLSDKGKTFIYGDNGSGKSTIIDGICFALFGCAFRKINKGMVVNTINGKKCEVKCEFEIGTDAFLVERGIKPNIFNIYKNGVLLEQTAASKDYQKILEDDILGINYNTFTQIAILSSASFVPFMKLSSGDRRTIVEDLLDIKVFSSMTKLAKDKMSATITELNDINYVITAKQDKITTLKSFISKIKEEEKNKDSEIGIKIEKFEQEIEALSAKIAPLEAEKLKLYAEIGDAPDISSKKTQIVAATQKLEAVKRGFCTEHKFFSENDSCPTCEQPIDGDFKSTKLKFLTESIEKRNVALESATTTIKQYEERQNVIDSIVGKIRSIDVEIATCNSDISNIRWKIKQLKTDQDKTFVSLDKEREQIETIGKELDGLITEKYALEDTKNYLDAMSLLLKDTGIKSSIVKQYVPILNHFINQYLAAMEFFVTFSFDENFNDTILIRQRDSLSYYGLSEGQKKRVDLAILFAFREISEAKNICNTNILFLDEILDSALDVTGIATTMGLLDAFAHKNIFVISPKSSDLDCFDAQLKVSMVNNYSHVQEISG